ncbi:tetratricopeptide repeat protein [Altererythrobacter lutimaris]|uniref:Cytochrome c biogenesis factor n=1 Tax=Altererythrobacter lutimaris TaxID=2743979 RepID=A0A850H9F9_9SPHN|nr:cytochrome c biogenesis factor [Altererythrobacter lutimaris]NVE94399.1 cytochrome c biogenesis factor [Altererythrobacter lutimaris]
MSWLPILAVAIVAFLLAAFVLRIPKPGWALMASALMLGLAGYAFQGNPGYAGAPKAAQEQVQEVSGEALVAARRGLFSPTDVVPDYLTVSDGFARRGRYKDAADVLKSSLRENPTHGEGWLALALALTEHTGGQVTPPAVQAFGRAEANLPGHPAPGYFLGTAFLRSGRPNEARQVWVDLLEKTPEDAPWHGDLTFRIAQVDQMIEMMRQMQEQHNEGG